MIKMVPGGQHAFRCKGTNEEIPVNDALPVYKWLPPLLP